MGKARVLVDGRPARILFISADKAGCGFYRCFMPSYFIAEQRLFDSRMGGKDGGCNPRDIEWADIIVTQRTMSADTPVFQMATEMGKRVVIENDDLYKKIPTGSHARKFFPLEVVKGCYEAMAHADALTVTTQPLKDEYEKTGPKCFVIPNALDTEVDHNYQPIGKGGKIRIGYHGSATHSVDFEPVIGAIDEVLKERPEVEVEALGYFPAILVARYPLRIKINGWAPLNQFYNAIRKLNAQFMIAPISENDFNNCKSNLKIIEYGLIRTPFIASKFGPYVDFTARSGGGLTVKNRHKDWKRALLRLVDMAPNQRQAMGDRGRRYVENHYNIRKTVHKWADVAEYVLNRPPNPKRIKLYASKAKVTQGDRLAVLQAR